MRHLDSIRKLDYIVGSGLLVAAIGILFSAGQVLVAPTANNKDLAVKSTVVANAQCLKALASLGVMHTSSEALLSVREPSVRELSSLMERASLVIQSCPGHEVASFCAGDNCLPERGLLVELKMVGQ